MFWRWEGIWDREVAVVAVVGVVDSLGVVGTYIPYYNFPRTFLFSPFYIIFVV
ncbi:MAG: hypothetical protein MR536_03500 [Prevotella sp.]|nr:hypothetical protein [Prevotella sp.]